MNRRPNPGYKSQRGAVLAVVLILLTVMTLLGLLSLRGTLMEERMSSNQRDRSLSFQAAEQALRVGEKLASTKPTLPGGGALGSGCSLGKCAIPDPAVVNPPWADNSAVWATAPSVTMDPTSQTADPQYIVELLADNVPPTGSCTTSGDVSQDAECTGTERRYRVTARSTAADRAQVMLQSIYAVP